MFPACEKPVDWDMTRYAPPGLVVEGMVTNHPGMNYVKLSLPVANSGSLPEPVSHALVAVSDGQDTLLLIENDTIPGVYLPPATFVAVINRQYQLFVRTADTVCTAVASMVPVTPLGDFSFRQDPAITGQYLIDATDSPEPSMVRYIVEWPVDSLPGQKETVVFYHYTLSTIDVNQVFKPGAEKLSFPADASIIREKYSLSPGYESFIRSLLSETEWKGGWFDVLPGNLTTNLTGGAVGYFSACSVLTDTVRFVQAAK